MWGNLPEPNANEPKLDEANNNASIPEENQIEVVLSHGEKQLFSSIKDTLENMIFASVEEINIIYAKVGVTSPVQGCLTIIISEKLARNITASMYAMDEAELESTMVLDTIAELANTISGEFIELIIPKEQTFELTVPDMGKSKNFNFSEKAFVWPLLTNGEMFTIGIEGEDLLKLFKPEEEK